MTYISGRLGVWAICDRCGEKVRRSRIAKEWTSLMVCRDTCLDRRPYQMDAPDIKPEGLAVPDARPRPTDVFVDDEHPITGDDY